MTFPAHSMYIAEGFMEDCEELIHSLTDKHEKVDWQIFCKQWKEMQFDGLFYGRQSGAEVMEFTEELLQCARLYMVTETDNFEDQVIGTFIAYAITIIQPYKNLCSLRLIPQDVVQLKKIEAIARRDNRTDILMILGRLYVYSTHFHVCAREQAMDFSIRKYFDDSTKVPQTIRRRWHGELNRTNVKNWESIAEKAKSYFEIKNRARLIAENVFPGSNVLVDTFKPEAEQIVESLRKLIQGNKVDKNENVEEQNDVNSIKQKAMQNKVDPMRHLHGVHEREKESLSPVKNSPTKRSLSPGKNSPTKGSPKKSPTQKQDESQNIKEKKTQQKRRGRGKKFESARIEAVSTETFSLPSLESDVGAPQASNSPNNNRASTPETPFKGFTPNEIDISNSALTSPNYIKKPLDIESFPIDDLKSKTSRKPFTPYASKRKKNNQTSRPKKKAKNEQNTRYLLSSESDSNTDLDPDEDCDETKSNKPTVTISAKNKPSNETNLSIKIEKPVIKILDTDETYTGKEISIPTKEMVNRYIQFEVNNIVIQTDKDAPPDKDIEIEFIDNYTGGNDNQQDIIASDNDVKLISADNNVENKDIEENKEEKSKNEVQVVGSDKEGRDNETIEVYQIVTENRESDNNGNMEPTETFRNIRRRNCKRPNLRSKLKKMGILPVANLE